MSRTASHGSNATNVTSASVLSISDTLDIYKTVKKVIAEENLADKVATKLKDDMKVEIDTQFKDLDRKIDEKLCHFREELESKLRDRREL